MLDFPRKAQYDFADVVRLARLLRAPGGCDWDRAQTHSSIRRNFIEETLEACEAMDRDEPDHLAEELGDVLLQVVFHGLIEEDAGRFTLADVCTGVCRKLLDRHPHLFQPQCEKQDWEDLKRAQRGGQTVTQAMEGVSKPLPGLWRADKLQSKAAHSGLLPAPTDPAGDLNASVTALLQSPEEAALGETLWQLARLCRAHDMDPERALARRCEQFIRDFSRLEEAEAATHAAQK